MSPDTKANRVLVALEPPDLDRTLVLAKALALAKRGGPRVGGLKTGMEFIGAQALGAGAGFLVIGRPKLDFAGRDGR